LELYPPRAADFDRLFAVGQPVWVLNGGKPFAKAVVMPRPESPEAQVFAGRYRVRYEDGSHYHCRAGAIRPLYGSTGNPKTTIIVTAKTTHYRQLARLQLFPGESVLEIGSDLGACTAVLAESTNAPMPTHCHSSGEGKCDQDDDKSPWHPVGVAVGRAVGIDKSPQSVVEARRRFPGVPFHCVDVLTTPGVLRRLGSLASIDPPPNFSKISLSIVGEAEAAVAPVCGGSSFDAVFIDINGNRMIEAVAEVTRLVCRDLAHRPPRLIVVKSSEMAKALQAALDA
jgi:hypothetical protein